MNYFQALGVDLTPGTGKALFFNDRQGMLIVRAAQTDLEMIEAAIQVLNMVPPQINIKAKFVEVSQEDTKALGFDWYLGNTLMRNGTIGGQAGTAPSFVGTPTEANPIGVFPGNPYANPSTVIGSKSTDGLLTSGLRNPSTSLFTLTGILTDPQFRLVIKALQQRQGAELLAQPEVTTTSGRQAQMKAAEVQSVITSFGFQQDVGGVQGGGAGASDRNIKRDFAPVDSQQVLAKVAAMPITEWSYKADPATRHIGPMAQDFHAAFNIGPDDKHIAYLDASGVALVAIKALNEKNDRLEKELKDAAAQSQAKDAELKALKQRLEKLELVLSRLDK